MLYAIRWLLFLSILSKQNICRLISWEELFAFRPWDICQLWTNQSHQPAPSAASCSYVTVNDSRVFIICLDLVPSWIPETQCGILDSFCLQDKNKEDPKYKQGVQEDVVPNFLSHHIRSLKVILSEDRAIRIVKARALTYNWCHVLFFVHFQKARRK